MQVAFADAYRTAAFQLSDRDVTRDGHQWTKVLHAVTTVARLVPILQSGVQRQSRREEHAVLAQSLRRRHPIIDSIELPTFHTFLLYRKTYPSTSVHGPWWGETWLHCLSNTN